jgi:hypothetical protein
LAVVQFRRVEDEAVARGYTFVAQLCDLKHVELLKGLLECKKWLPSSNELQASSECGILVTFDLPIRGNAMACQRKS